MLIERIIELQLRGPGPPGCFLWQIFMTKQKYCFVFLVIFMTKQKFFMTKQKSIFYDKTKIFFWFFGYFYDKTKIFYDKTKIYFLWQNKNL